MARALLEASSPSLRQYSSRSRADRVIATGRMALAVFSLVAVRLDLIAPARRPDLFYLLLSAYVFYALFLALLEWGLRAPVVRLGLLTHVFDLGVFSLFMFFTEGPTSPFFVYFVFSLLCATLRWQWRGVLWTALCALAAFVGMGVYAREVLREPAFELDLFVVRAAYLAVVAGLLGYLGVYEARVRREMSRLAEWPRVVPTELPALARELLEHAVGVLGVARALLTWEEPEEPWRHLAWLSDGEVHMSREPPGTFEPIVPEPLADASFLCADARSENAMVLHTSPTGLRRWHGEPCHPDLRERFTMHHVLALSLRGDIVEGHLFALDKPWMTADDLVLGEIVARQAAARMDHFYLAQRLQQAAATEERIRLARDLHDGVLQSLTGTTLQIESARSLIADAPDAARERLAEIQRLIGAEQRELREFIRHLKPAPLGVFVASASLAARLDELRARIERQWGLTIELSAAHLDGRVSERLAYEMYRIVQEAIVNAARHAQASAVRVEVDVPEGEVRITVADNGRGFSFRGHYELAALTDLGLGPRTLKERIAAQGGSLAIDSTDTGARLLITLPLARADA